MFVAYKHSVRDLKTFTNTNRDVTDVTSLLIYDVVSLPMSSANHETADGDKDDEKG